MTSQSLAQKVRGVTPYQSDWAGLAKDLIAKTGALRALICLLFVQSHAAANHPV
jgi:hypothetical protein